MTNIFVYCIFCIVKKQNDILQNLTVSNMVISTHHHHHHAHHFHHPVH